MGTADTVISALVSMAFLAALFLFIDVVNQNSPGSVAGTSSGVTDTLWILRPMLRIEWVVYGVFGLIALGLVYSFFRLLSSIFS